MRLLSYMAKTIGLCGLMAVALSLLSGLSSAAALAWLGRHLASSAAILPSQLVCLAACILAAVLCDLMAKRQFIRLTSQATWNLRRVLARQILDRRFDELERIGTSRLTALMTEDVTKTAQVLNGLPAVLIAVASMLGCFVFLAYLSPWLLSVTCALAVPAVCIGFALHRRAGRCIREALRARDEAYEQFGSLTEGIKELKLHAARRAAFLADLLEPALVATQKQMSTARLWNQLTITGSQAGIFVLLLAVLVSVNWLPANPVVMTSFAVVMLYVKASVQAVLTWLPSWSEASAAIANLEKLGFSLSAPPITPSGFLPPVQPLHDVRLDLKGVCFRYLSDAALAHDDAFSLGPIDLTLRSGEVAFVIGGNGSGKTTLMKVLIGLYAPAAGSICLNGITITDDNREAYRQQFSVVFADFHIFKRLLGIDADDLEARTGRYLEQLQLADHVMLSQEGLSTTRLSHGQRQRLALLTAHLEDRPIYVFDEWAANQDPWFRDVFYRRILPELKARGKLVVVISHDDRYFDVADRLLRLTDGLLASPSPSLAAA
jgi:putative ATP-binding cassette transporter